MLDKLYLNQNMLRGVHGERILMAVRNCAAMSTLCLANNFLGLQTPGQVQPPIDLLADLLTNSKTLEHLDISYNQIDAKTCYCLSRGLQLSKSILYISMEGNPIGSSGIDFLMSARNRNSEMDFVINLKMVESEANAAADNRIKVFDPSKPEGPYDMQLSNMYD